VPDRDNEHVVVHGHLAAQKVCQEGTCRGPRRLQMCATCRRASSYTCMSCGATTLDTWGRLCAFVAAPRRANLSAMHGRLLHEQHSAGSLITRLISISTQSGQHPLVSSDRCLLRKLSSFMLAPVSGLQSYMSITV